MVLLVSCRVERQTVVRAQLGERWFIGHGNTRPIPVVTGAQDMRDPRIEPAEVECPQWHVPDEVTIPHFRQSALVDIPRRCVHPWISQNTVVEERRHEIEPPLLIDSHPANIRVALTTQPLLEKLQEGLACVAHRKETGIEGPNTKDGRLVGQVPIAWDRSDDVGNHHNAVLSCVIGNRLKGLEDHEITVDVDDRLDTVSEKMLERPRLDSGDQPIPEEHGHSVKLCRIDIEITQSQRSEGFVSLVDLSLDVVDQQRPELAIGMVLGERASQHASMGNVCPRHDRVGMDAQNGSPPSGARTTGTAMARAAGSGMPKIVLPCLLALGPLKLDPGPPGGKSTEATAIVDRWTSGS